MTRTLLLCLALLAAPAPSVVADTSDLSPTPSPAPTWTATPEATEVARAEPVSRGGGRRTVEDVAADHFPPGWVAWAIRTAYCESGGDLYAHSAGYDRRMGVWYEHVGAWQVSVPTWAGKAWELFGGSLDDPEVSAAMAAWIVVNIGPQSWPVCGYR